jgi:cytochrome c-type biogenesis protein CcmH
MQLEKEMKNIGLSLLIAIALGFLLTQSVVAQDPTPTPVITDDQVNAIARQMYCPVCENTPLDVCPTQACIEWRELIREQLAQGWTEQQIKEYFVQRFGARVLAAPPASGLNWLVYAIPPLAFLAGAILLYGAFRSFRKPGVKSTEEATQHVSADDPYIERIEEELRKQ